MIRLSYFNILNFIKDHPYYKFNLSPPEAQRLSEVFPYGSKVSNVDAHRLIPPDAQILKIRPSSSAGVRL